MKTVREWEEVVERGLIVRETMSWCRLMKTEMNQLFEISFLISLIILLRNQLKAKGSLLGLTPSRHL